MSNFFRIFIAGSTYTMIQKLCKRDCCMGTNFLMVYKGRRDMKNCSNSSVYCFGEISQCDHLRRVMTMAIMTIIMENNRKAMPPIAPATAATGNDSPPPPA